MKRRVLTCKQSADLLARIQERLGAYGLSSCLIVDGVHEANLRTLTEVIREAVHDFEDDRRAAKRKSKPEAPPVVGA